MRTKTGNIKKSYEHILPKVSEVIHKLVQDLCLEKLDPEEIIGIIAGQAVISVGTERTKKKIHES